LQATIEISIFGGRSSLAVIVGHEDSTCFGELTRRILVFPLIHMEIIIDCSLELAGLVMQSGMVSYFDRVVWGRVAIDLIGRPDFISIENKYPVALGRLL
jgi:hypothetical protein